MLSNLLKNNFIAGAILMFLVVFALVFLPGGEVSSVEQGGLLFTTLFEHLESPISLRIFSAFFLLSSALLLNYIVLGTEVVSRPSFFPAFLYVIIGSETFITFYFHPVIIAALSLLIALWRILGSYRLDSARAAVFDSAFFFSLATLFYPACALLLPVFFISLLVIRPYVWREWVFSFLGLCVPYFMVWSTLFLLGRLHLLSIHFSHFDFRLQWPVEVNLFGTIFMLLLCLYSVFAMVSGAAARKVRQQKNLSLFNYWLLFAFLSFLFVPSPPAAIPFLLVPALSVRVGEWLGEFRKNSWSDLVLFSITGCCAMCVLKIKGII